MINHYFIRWVHNKYWTVDKPQRPCCSIHNLVTSKAKHAYNIQMFCIFLFYTDFSFTSCTFSLQRLPFIGFKSFHLFWHTLTSYFWFLISASPDYPLWLWPPSCQGRGITGIDDLWSADIIIRGTGADGLQRVCLCSMSLKHSNYVQQRFRKNIFS